MPNKCGVVNCRGNYNKENKHCVFHLPKEQSERHMWLDVLPPRENVVVNPDKFFILRSRTALVTLHPKNGLRSYTQFDETVRLAMNYDIQFDKKIQNVVTLLQAYTSACVDTEKEKLSLHKGPSLKISMTPVHKLTAAYQLERVKEAAAAVERAGGRVIRCITDNYEDTKKAVEQTTQGLLAVCRYLFRNADFQYVLLREIQSERLEGEFSVYRQSTVINRRESSKHYQDIPCLELLVEGVVILSARETITRTGVGKVVDIDLWGLRTELKGSINLWGSEGGRLRIYTVEAGFSHANAILKKQRNRLNLENRGDLRLMLTKFKPNINSLAAAHQAHPSH
ncbi:hypothetical protein FHG87_019680 [Trinorchestia longiramus]|nr:hypothetical protein FHG87_019680 [Trinorchestia longiramus]